MAGVFRHLYSKTPVASAITLGAKTAHQNLVLQGADVEGAVLGWRFESARCSDYSSHTR